MLRADAAVVKDALALDGVVLARAVVPRDVAQRVAAAVDGAIAGPSEGEIRCH